MRLLQFTVVTFAATIYATTFLSAAGPLVLSKEGKTDYIIVLPAEPTVVENTATRELKVHLEAVTGAEFNTVSETEADASSPQIIVGDVKRVKELLPNLDISKIPQDGIVLKTVGENIVLVGHPRQGTLYAVYTFLEDVVGVRWWTSTEAFIPKKPTLEIPELSVEYAPKATSRSTLFSDSRNERNGVFAARLKFNGGASFSADFGDRAHGCKDNGSHSFMNLLPPWTYFEKHPEWYGEINGQRGEWNQICLTNEEALAEVTKNVLNLLRKDPTATWVSVSQDDHDRYCRCAKCKAVDEEEGSQAGTMIRFVNKVAEAVEKEFPNVTVHTFAYAYSRKPPKFVKPRKNVQVQLCSIECSFVQPLAEGEQNKDFREDIKGWGEIHDNVSIWDYVVNFQAYMIPHPNHRVLVPNVRFFIDHKITSVFEQGDGWGGNGDFVRLKNWMLAKAMWDPSVDGDELTEEFVMGYYGPKYGPMIHEYLTILHDRAEASGVYLRCGRSTTNDWLDFKTWAKLCELTSIMDENDKDDVYYKRARRDLLPMDLVFLRDYYTFRRQAALVDSGMVKKYFADPEFILNRFFEVHAANGGGALSEFNSPAFEKVEAELRLRIAPVAAMPEFCKDLPRTSWMDIQSTEIGGDEVGKRLFRIIDEKASDKRALKIASIAGGWPAVAGIYDSEIELTPVKAQVEGEPQYRAYAAVRCEAAEDVEGPVMSIGTYTWKTDQGSPGRTINVEDVRGEEYHWVDLGIVPDRLGESLWFSPADRLADEVEGFYVDRIVIVREQ